MSNKSQVRPDLYGMGPMPLLTFKKIKILGKTYSPNFGDRHSLLILKRVMSKKVSFMRAYTGWVHSGGMSSEEMSEGRSFFRWLQKYSLSVEWSEEDFSLNHFFSSPRSPKHDPQDEMAKNLSFAIRPVRVQERNIKLYIEDQDILSLFNLSYGNDEDFLALVSEYVASRFQWAKWNAPSPSFLDWVKARGLRPVFQETQIGFSLPIIMGRR